MSDVEIEKIPCDWIAPCVGCRFLGRNSAGPRCGYQLPELPWVFEIKDWMFAKNYKAIDGPFTDGAVQRLDLCNFREFDNKQSNDV